MFLFVSFFLFVFTNKNLNILIFNILENQKSTDKAQSFMNICQGETNISKENLGRFKN